jgi:acyl carrier protein
MKDAVSWRVSRVLSCVFGVPPEWVSASTSQSTVESWDSLSHIHLITALEAEFSVSFTPEQTRRMTSVQAICDILRCGVLRPTGAPDV